MRLLTATTALAAACLIPGLGGISSSAQISPKPQSMQPLGDVDPRFLSYNVEAVEVTGGRFWKPYKDNSASKPDAGKPQQNQPAGMDADLFQYRDPINLYNPKLRRLAAALAPAFIRVSGTWRNSTYFQNDDLPAMSAPPEGYKGVMTRAEWKGVVDFSHAVHADVVTSVAMSAGTRDTDGRWTPDQAKALFDYTNSIGGHISASEFMNEPTFAMVGGAPKGYDAAAYAKDAENFGRFLKRQSPNTLFLGPGSIGEGVSLTMGAPMPGFIETPDMMKASGPIYDVFSYHFYETVSRRCSGPKAAATPEQALTSEWLQRNLITESFYAKVRDEFMPGKPLWLTETGEAGCGGDPFAATFTDTFRFMDQLGSLAQKGVKTVIVNTLASSDYGLLDEETLEPRPNYWGALLWKRTMGSRVLDPGLHTDPKVRIYAHCGVQSSGAVALLVMNLDKSVEQRFELPMGAEQFTLTAPDPLSRSVALNNVEMHTAADGAPPEFSPRTIKAGSVRLPALSITFFVLPGANNSNCK